MEQTTTNAPTAPMAKLGGMPTTDALLERALSNKAPEAPDTKASPAKEPKAAKEPQSVREEQVGEADDELDELEGTPADDDEPELDQEDDEEESAEPEVGTKDKPYTRRDLPSDQFVKVKVDGEEAVVSFAELADGYVRQQTFSKRINRTSEVMAEAKQLVERARAEPERLRANVEALFRDPHKLHWILRENYEDTLSEVGKLFAADLEVWERNPAKRHEFVAQRNHRQLEMQRNAFRAEQEVAQRTQAEQAAIAERKAVIEPGWNKGLKDAGYPEVDAELVAMTKAVLQNWQEVNAGKVADANVIAQCVVRAAKVLDRRPKDAPPPQRLNIARREPGVDRAPSRPGKAQKKAAQPASFREAFSEQFLMSRKRGR